MASLSVLMLELSSSDEYGAVSTATQISDSLGRVMFIAVGGSILATRYASASGTTMFGSIYAVMIVLAAMGVWMAPRMRPRSGHRPRADSGFLQS